MERRESTQRREGKGEQLEGIREAEQKPDERTKVEKERSVEKRADKSGDNIN